MYERDRDRTASDYGVRLVASLLVVALMIVLITRPTIGHDTSQRIASIGASLDHGNMADKPCRAGHAPLSHPFVDIADVLSISPLGEVTAPGEVMPAPYLRINTGRGENAFERKSTNAMAPTRADITAIERFATFDENGRASETRWHVHMRACEDISFSFDKLDEIPTSILEAAGGLSAFHEIGGPGHIAIDTRIRVQAGDVIGEARGFDFALHDMSAPPLPLERPERYRTNTYARAVVFNAPTTLIDAITPQTAHARCALDYLPQSQQAAWRNKLGDSWGIRKAAGENACRTAIADEPGALRGVWYTDASHNGAASKVSAIALSPDAIDPDRLIFALHGRLSSLKPAMIALPPMMEEAQLEATRDFISLQKGDGRINRSFDRVKDNELICYERMRANFVGPTLNAVILAERTTNEQGTAILKMEARGDVLSCINLPDPWAFTGNETIFFR